MNVSEVAAWLLLIIAVFKSLSALLMYTTRHKGLKDWLVILSFGSVSAVGWANGYRRFINPSFDSDIIFLISLAVLAVVSAGITFFIWRSKRGRHDY